MRGSRAKQNGCLLLSTEKHPYVAFDPLMNVSRILGTYHLSPALYDALIEMLSDQLLSEEAERRMSAAGGEEVTLSEMMQKSGMTDKDLEGWEDVEID